MQLMRRASRARSHARSRLSVSKDSIRGAAADRFATRDLGVGTHTHAHSFSEIAPACVENAALNEKQRQRVRFMRPAEHPRGSAGRAARCKENAMGRK